MTDAGPALTPREPDPRLKQIVKIAIMAVGGQGGGVLASWIERLARDQGYICQTTSVAGVAQRTGATIYYIEMVPRAGSGRPVFALAPAAGDVDVLIAAEMMEAGRAIMRGFVTPDRTTLIASTHRALAVSEKMVPGDGIATAQEVVAAAEIAAARFVQADMEQIAVSHGSVISASLFGALAGAGVLPFERRAFEEAIRRGGRGTARSLRAFSGGFDAVSGVTAAQPETEEGVARAADSVAGSETSVRGWARLGARTEELPDPVREIAYAGLRKVVEFQDIRYGEDYLNRLSDICARDAEAKKFGFSVTAAKYIANAMAYDDVIRVACLKTRRSRFERIGREMGAGPDALMKITEYMHPRAEEIVGMLPAGPGARIMRRPGLMHLINRLFGKPRRLRTDSLWGFGSLWLLAGLRRRRRRTLRHRQETQHLDLWLKTALDHLDTDYDLAVEILKCRRLIKGYSDTHARGNSKFAKVLAGASEVAGRPDAAAWVARLRDAALSDEKGEALDGALMTIRSFTDETGHGS